MKWRIRKYKYNSCGGYLMILMLILLLSHKFFYLYLQDDYMFGHIKYSDIGIILSVVFTCFVLLRFKTPKITLALWIYGYFGLALISAVTAWAIFDQNIIRGIFAQRVQLAYLFFFFGAYRLLELGVVKKEDVYRIVYILCWIELIICTIQYYVYSSSGSLFLRVQTNVRYGTTRFYFDPGLFVLIVFSSFENILKQKKGRLLNTVFLLWFSFFLMVITKMRMMTLAFFITLIVGVVVWRGRISVKAVIISLGGILLVIAISRIAIIKDIFSALNDLADDANYMVRVRGRYTYFNELLKSPITGRGYPSVSSVDAYRALKGFYFVDNGFWGIVYSYGVLGVIWLVSLWIKLIIDSWRARRIKLSYLLFFVYYTVGSLTDFAWFWTATASFSLLVATMYSDKAFTLEGCDSAMSRIV